MNGVIAEQSGEYRINLPMFEGPLDLLMHLIRKHDIDIRDIPIAVLTEEYVAYIESLQSLNIDLAGEFLLMAAELMHIKSQMLLPMSPELEEVEIDPREDLVRRLMEYQRFKAAAEALDQQPVLMRNVYHRLGPSELALEEQTLPPLQEGNVFHLIEAFHKVLKNMPKESYHVVAVDRVSVSQRIYELMEQVQAGRSLSIATFLPKRMTRYDIVITFLALLEMARLKMVTLFQGGRDELLYISGRMKDEGAAHGA